MIQDLYLPHNDDLVQIGIGNDPSDIQSVITTIPGYISYYADDVQVDSNEMWFAAIGGLQDSGMRVRVGVTAIDLRSEYNCICRTLLFDSLWFLILIKSPEIIKVIYKCIDKPLFIQISALSWRGCPNIRSSPTLTKMIQQA